MSGYFSSFPVSTYAQTLCTNLTLRAALLDQVKLNNSLYYPYTIKEGERPDSVAFNYYGKCEYDWIIFIANNIIDPYYDWPLDQETFDNYITTKYGSVAAAQSQILYYQKQPYTWYFSNSDNTYLTAAQFNLLNPAVQSNYSAYMQDDQVQVSPLGYQYIPVGEQPQYLPVYAYDNEFQANEDKRYIKLIDKTFTPTMVSALNKVMSQ